MTRNKVLLAALLGLTMLAGCNESNSPVDTADTSGTFTECKGTVVDGVCLKTPDPVVCEAGSTLVGTQCVKDPVVCETGTTLVDGICKAPVPVVCESGSSLVGGQCVKDPVVCESGTTLVDGICKTPDPVVCEAGSSLVGTQCVKDPIVCETGTTLVDGICKTPDPVVVCESGSSLVGGQCVKDPIVCETGTERVGGVCVVPPVVCETGTTPVGGVCVKPPVVCKTGTVLIDGACVKSLVVCGDGGTKVGEVCARDPANLDNGMRSLTWNTFTASITADPATLAQRTYQLTTTQPGRAALAPNRPAALKTTAAGGTLRIPEQPGQPVIRTGSPMFDGLFALALQEAGALTSTTIQDGAYNGGAAIPCGGTVGCYRTGTLWSYVWTRDTAYAVDLGLAQINPRVARNSLLFKLSQRRDSALIAGPDEGVTLLPEPAVALVPNSVLPAEIVQDTGSGGSWPISTDRVVWARAAFELLKYLDGAERTEFLGRAYRAIRNTVENDRFAVYDSRDGLYRGESSFTDWREQTYPGWTANTVVHIAMSKTLSTNVNFWKILDVAASMATELNRPVDAARYKGWADNLKTAINRELWLSDRGLYSMMKTTELDQVPVSRYELLGET